jgi:hypothetical protein
MAPDAPPDGPPPPAVACPPMMGPRIASDVAPSAVAIADVNADGKVDLLVAAGTTLDVHRGNGDGTLQAPTRTAVPPGRVVIATGDLDGDGDLDVALGTQLVINDGTGTFTLGTALPGSATSVALTDLDGNGKLDIVTASIGQTTGLGIYLGTGGGQFAAPVALDAPNAYDSVVAFDVDGDQRVDLVAAGGTPRTSGELAVFAGNGDGTFDAPVVTTIASDTAIRVVVGDLNGDGVTDLVTAGWKDVAQSFSVESWAGAGTTTFTLANRTGGGPDRRSDVPPSFQSGYPVAPEIADVDGDGKLDVVISFAMSNLLVLMRGMTLSGFGSFAVDKTGFVESGSVSALAIGDLDRDGRLDAAVAAANAGFVQIVPGSPISTFRAPRALPGGLGNLGIPFELAVGEVDGDGLLDFASGPMGYDGDPFVPIIFMVHSADTAFGPDDFYAVPPDPNERIGQPENDELALRDLDGDGDLDLVLAADRVFYGWLTVFPNDGTGKFGPRADYPTDLTRDLAIGDLDGDSKPELVLASVPENTSSFMTTVYKNDGTGAFTAQAAFATQIRIALADVNHDSKLDLIEYGRLNAVTVRLGNGDTTFGAPIDTAMTGVVQHLAVADIDGDSTLDLGADTLALIGHGDGTFSVGETLPAAPGGLLALADLDRTPPIDIVGKTGAIYRAGSASSTELWPIAAKEFRDVTGDGHPDAAGILRTVNTAFVLSSQCP